MIDKLTTPSKARAVKRCYCPKVPTFSTRDDKKTAKVDGEANTQRHLKIRPAGKLAVTFRRSEHNGGGKVVVVLGEGSWWNYRPQALFS